MVSKLAEVYTNVTCHEYASLFILKHKTIISRVPIFYARCLNKFSPHEKLLILTNSIILIINIFS